MDLQLHYTSEGGAARIAFASVGSGEPALICVSPWNITMDGVVRNPDATDYFVSLAAERRVVLYDRRGTGASTRGANDLDLQSQVHDLAVVAKQFRAPVDVLAHTEGCPTAIAYAAEHSDSVRKLALYRPTARVVDDQYRAAAMSSAKMMRENPVLARRLISTLVFPDGPPESQRWFRQNLEAGIDAEVAATYMELDAFHDVTTYLPRVLAPTLVVQTERTRRHLAREDFLILPAATFVSIRSRHFTPYPGHARLVKTIKEFMGFATEAEGFTITAKGPGTAVILFADIVDSTALTERMGDVAFRAASRALDLSIRTAVRDSGGTPVEGKVLGDGVMGVFTSATEAIAAARSCAELSRESELRLHLGLHAGDVISEGDNVYGGAVNIASRICGLCEPGDILVSQTVRDLARTSAGVTFEDRGEHTLKGITDPVRVFAVVPASP